jgi:DHA1 family multidrug resistance protein-like MFS transporter
MSKKQLVALFLCNFVTFTIGNGLLPLLPVYAIKLGASNTLAGYYVAFSFIALAMGTLVAGKLSDLLQRRKTIIIISAILNVLTIWLIGRVTNLWQLTLITGITWFLGGIILALVAILAGLFSADNERGKIFGILGMTASLGMLVGGLTIGPIVDKWDYPIMFLILSLFTIIQPLSALLMEDKTIARNHESESQNAKIKQKFGSALVLLLIAHVFAMTTNGIGNMGRSISMNEKGFSSTAITSTSTVGGIVGLPIPYLIGRLSDRFGRKSMMLVSYISGVLCLPLLAGSKSLWQFWVFAALISILYASISVGPAFVTDLVQQENLGLGISLFQTAMWVGSIIGFAGSGYAFELFGLPNTLMIGSLLPIIAISLLIVIRKGTLRKV